jgi:hypothetical protein
MATFITGTHHCPDCREAHIATRVFEERRENGLRTDWCEFHCPSGHVWARPGMQAAK